MSLVARRLSRYFANPPLRGTSATIVVPAPGLDSSFSLPPRSASRSPMPSNPSPSLRSPVVKPRPSSSITAVTAWPLRATTMLTALACACLTMFVSDSCTIR